MKVKELIEKLQKFDPEAEIEVPVQTYTQRYPSGYFKLSEVTTSPWPNCDGSYSPRLWVHLPEGFVISEYKHRKGS